MASSVSDNAMGLASEESCFDSQWGYETRISRSDSFWDTPSLLFNRYRGSFTAVVVGRPDHSLPSSAEDINE